MEGRQCDARVGEWRVELGRVEWVGNRVEAREVKV